jgi:hypothetical protein
VVAEALGGLEDLLSGGCGNVTGVAIENQRNCRLRDACGFGYVGGTGSPFGHNSLLQAVSVTQVMRFT